MPRRFGGTGGASGRGRYGRRRRGDSRRAALRLALLAPAWGLGCGEPEPSSPSVASPAGQTEAAAAIPAAVYRTTLTFAGFAPQPLLAHLAFENRTGPGEVGLAYRGWLARGGGWQTVLSIRDTLPLPRAAWRVLPTPGALAIRVGEAGEVLAVRLGSPEGDVRLEAGGEAAACSGDGGPRESLRAATLWLAGEPETGLLLTRQYARPVADSASAPAAHAFVVADSAGDGLALVREGGPADAAASAWTRMDGLETEWGDAVLRTLGTPAGAAGRWAVQLPEAGVHGELEGGPPVIEEQTPTGSRQRVFRTVGTLVIGGRVRRLVGVGVEEVAPAGAP